MKRIITLLSATLLCLSFSNASKAQIFVKLLDASGNLINGESTDARHAKEITATTFGQENTGCAINAGGAGGGTCGGTAGHFIFNMNINASLPILDQAVFLGTHLKSADIVFRKTTNLEEYYKIHLESVVISHVTNSADLTTGPITIQVELAADRMGWTYYPQTPSGQLGTPVKFGWNAQTRSTWSF
jgi:type VI secretion system Hcp family effector